MIKFDLDTEADTARLAGNLSTHVAVGDCVLLKGDLGAGKTTFARGLISGIAARFGVDAPVVPSPTFSILQPYDLGGFQISHFDLYRIEDQTELQEIGLEDALDNGLTLIEWPGIAEDFLPVCRLCLQFSLMETHRTVTLSGALLAGPIAQILSSTP